MLKRQRHPKHLLLLLRHHRHLHVGRRRDARRGGERVPGGVRVGGLRLLPPRRVLVQAVEQQAVEAPGLQESINGGNASENRVTEIWGQFTWINGWYCRTGFCSLRSTSFISVDRLLMSVRAATNASSQPEDPAMSTAADADASLLPPEPQRNGAE